jgi:virginiamycin A acetyltransferase
LDPDLLHPIAGDPGTVFLRPLLARAGGPANVTVGEWTYYRDFADPLPFFHRNVRYNFGFSGSRLQIGRYCALAHGTAFLMDDANHATAGLSTYPFPVLGGAWADAAGVADIAAAPRGDIVVGNDVWFGMESLVLPGVRVGHGAIIGARAVVASDVPDYAVAVGNPARVVRRRFDDATIARLLEIAWWNWAPQAVAAAVPALIVADVAALAACAPAGLR